ncbi:MAG: hypothetical protein ACYSTX_05865 [Planctomycetota bacterium]
MNKEFKIGDLVVHHKKKWGIGIVVNYSGAFPRVLWPKGLGYICGHKPQFLIKLEKPLDK